MFMKRGSKTSGMCCDDCIDVYVHLLLCIASSRTQHVCVGHLFECDDGIGSTGTCMSCYALHPFAVHILLCFERDDTVWTDENLRVLLCAWSVQNFISVWTATSCFFVPPHMWASLRRVVLCITSHSFLTLSHSAHSECLFSVRDPISAKCTLRLRHVYPHSVTHSVTMSPCSVMLRHLGMSVRSQQASAMSAATAGECLFKLSIECLDRILIYEIIGLRMDGVMVRKSGVRTLC